MNSTFRNSILAATVLAAGVVAQASAAPTVNIRDNAGLQGSSVFAFSPASGEISLNGGSSYGSQAAGAFGLQYDVAGGAVTWTNFLTYCFEITQTLSVPTAYDAQLLSTGLTGTATEKAAKTAAIERLWKARFSEATTNAGTGLVVAGDTLAERSAAFQLAIWEISTDNNVDGADAGTDGLSEGTVRAKRTGTGVSASETRVYDIAVAYLALAYGSGAREVMYSLLSPTGQDLLMPCAELFGATSTACGGPGGSGDPVPAPATLVLFGAGLMALAGMRRRKA